MTRTTAPIPTFNPSSWRRRGERHQSLRTIMLSRMQRKKFEGTDMEQVREFEAWINARRMRANESSIDRESGRKNQGTGLEMRRKKGGARNQGHQSQKHKGMRRSRRPLKKARDHHQRDDGRNGHAEGASDGKTQLNQGAESSLFSGEVGSQGQEEWDDEYLAKDRPANAEKGYTMSQDIRLSLRSDGPTLLGGQNHEQRSFVLPERTSLPRRSRFRGKRMRDPR